MKKMLRINLITGIYIIINYFYLKGLIGNFSFFEFVRFSFSDLDYYHSIGITEWNLFRLSSMTFLLVWWLVELLKDIVETNKYSGMLIHRYKSLLEYYLYVVKKYSGRVFKIIGCYVVSAFVIYVLLGIGFHTEMNFFHLEMVFIYFIKVFFIYLFLICIINLFDLINKGQIAYIAISIVLVLYIISESVGLHSSILFFTENIVLNLFYGGSSILLIGTLFIGYKWCIERRDVL